MKKVILFMAGILASMMLNAQSRWSVTPEAGLVVNKENEGTSVALRYKPRTSSQKKASFPPLPDRKSVV